MVSWAGKKDLLHFRHAWSVVTHACNVACTVSNAQVILLQGPVSHRHKQLPSMRAHRSSMMSSTALLGMLGSAETSCLLAGDERGRRERHGGRGSADGCRRHGRCERAAGDVAAA